MVKRKNDPLINGSATHRRTETDYMGILLDSVSLDDWQDVVKNALQAAKNGDQNARAWLAQYLIGKPQANAPTPLKVVVQQWSGKDPIADQLANPIIEQDMLPSMQSEFEDSLRARISQELDDKSPKSK